MLSEIYSIFLISSNAVACRTWPEFKSRQEKSIIQRVNGLFCTAFEATDEKLTIAPCYCSSMTLLLYNIDAQLTVIYSFIEIKINKPLQEKKHWENIKSKKWCFNRSLAWILQNRTRQWWWLRHTSAQRGAFCHFSCRWIYYYHSSKSNWQNAPLCSDVAVIQWGSCLSKIYRGGPAYDQVTGQIKSIDWFVGSIFCFGK